MAAKKKNNDGFDFNSFFKELTAKKVEEVAVEQRQERKYFLIVSEGVRTEPLYFEYLGEKLPKHLIDTVTVSGAGDNTVNVVKKALELVEKRKRNKDLPAYNEVWAVYDKDDFPAKRYHEAIKLAAKEGIESAHSNQSFELWFVLHFQFLQSNLHRTDYIKTLSKELGYKYEKNVKKIAEFIHTKGNVKQAMKWAEELEKLHQGKAMADSCPYTRVYVLVERLLAYIENREPEY